MQADVALNPAEPLEITREPTVVRTVGISIELEAKLRVRLRWFREPEREEQKVHGLGWRRGSVFNPIERRPVACEEKFRLLGRGEVLLKIA